MEDESDKTLRQFYIYPEDKPYTKIEKADVDGAIGFPSRLSLTSYVEHQTENGKRMNHEMRFSFYEPIPGSYKEDDQHKFIDYLHYPSKNFALRIIYRKYDNLWLAKKFTVAGELIDTYCNEELDGLVHHILVSGYR